MSEEESILSPVEPEPTQLSAETREPRSWTTPTLTPLNVGEITKFGGGPGCDGFCGSAS